MQMTFLIKGSQKKLLEEIEKKTRQGWQRHGDVLIIQPIVTTDLEVPKFVRFWQTMTKDW
jgi:hypothetical protein